MPWETNYCPLVVRALVAGRVTQREGAGTPPTVQKEKARPGGGRRHSLSSPARRSPDKVKAEEVRQLLGKFRVRRLSMIPEEERQPGNWADLPESHLHTLCLRSCSDQIVRSFIAASPRLQSLQVVDSKLLGEPSVQLGSLTSLSLTGANRA